LDKNLILIPKGACVDTPMMLEDGSVRVVIGAGARITCIDVIEHSVKYRSIIFELHEQSSVTFISVITQPARFELKVYLQGQHAFFDGRGVYFASGKGEFEVITSQYHASPDATSTLCFKGIVQDQAQGIYRGTITIHEDAYRTIASLENKNLLLSDQARVVSIPNLEVKTHEVHCSHGSAVGRLDEQQLMYLQSRGLDWRCAQRLILESFVAHVSSILGRSAIEQSCSEVIQRNLG
jgi:Fe-S cluster assembly protein SufD